MSDIKIQNMPELEDGFEYSFGKPGGLGGGNWEMFTDVSWSKGKRLGGSVSILYRRPLPKPEPEPEREIRLPIEWDLYPSVKVGRRKDGMPIDQLAHIGLRHYHNGRVYRLCQFIDDKSDGYIVPFFLDGKKATRAVFVLVEDES